MQQATAQLQATAEPHLLLPVALQLLLQGHRQALVEAVVVSTACLAVLRLTLLPAPTQTLLATMVLGSNCRRVLCRCV